jgi:hypothetical protein
MAEDRRTDDRKREGEVLGLGDTPISSGPDDEVSRMAPDAERGMEDASRRRRRADDIEEREARPRDPIGGPDAPPGLHVED